VQPKETEDMQKLLSDFDDHYRSEAGSSAAVDEVQPTLDYKPATMRNKAQASIVAASAAASAKLNSLASSSSSSSSSKVTSSKSASLSTALAEDQSAATVKNGPSSTTQFFNAMNRNTMVSNNHGHSSRYQAFAKKGLPPPKATNSKNIAKDK
jgi:hypothetical protein